MTKRNRDTVVTQRGYTLDGYHTMTKGATVSTEKTTKREEIEDLKFQLADVQSVIDNLRWQQVVKAERRRVKRLKTVVRSLRAIHDDYCASRQPVSRPVAEDVGGRGMSDSKTNVISPEGKRAIVEALGLPFERLAVLNLVIDSEGVRVIAEYLVVDAVAETCARVLSDFKVTRS